MNKLVYHIIQYTLTDFQAIPSSLASTHMPALYHSVYTVLCKTQRLEARRRAKLGESKIATKLADKILSHASILLKRDGRTYLRLFHGSMSPLFFL